MCFFLDFVFSFEEDDLTDLWFLEKAEQEKSVEQKQVLIDPVVVRSLLEQLLPILCDVFQVGFRRCLSKRNRLRFSIKY